ncbi:MAG TPA: hypothetical protein P5042_02365, partial [Candidatus Izemoplasmatales bacterium]|nr:hypothetical protein [Candidatus Izemoplasmatales bacterium]
MEVKITYPARDRKKSRALLLRSVVKWLFVASAYVCPIINISAGGPAWSIYVLWFLLFVWSFAFSPDLVEYNLISQTAKFLVFTCVLLALIDIIHSLGWAMFVIPIICFGGLAVIA